MLCTVIFVSLSVFTDIHTDFPCIEILPKANVNNIYIYINNFLVFANRRLKALAIAETVGIAKETAHQLMHGKIRVISISTKANFANIGNSYCLQKLQHRVKSML